VHHPQHYESFHQRLAHCLIAIQVPFDVEFPRCLHVDRMRLEPVTVPSTSASSSVPPSCALMLDPYRVHALYALVSS